MERQGIGIERVPGGIEKLTETRVGFRGLIGRGGARIESVRETRSYRQRSPEPIVDGHAEEMLALDKPLDDTLEILVVGASGYSFETLLHALGKRGSAVRQIIAEIAALRARLVGGVKKGDTDDAYGERQHKFQRGAHAEASERDERIPDNLLAGPTPRILREFKCASGRAGALEISAIGKHERGERTCKQEALSLKRKKMARGWALGIDRLNRG